MKSVWKITVSAVAVAYAAWAGNAPQESEKGPKRLKVLAIGNSFTACIQKQLPDVAKDLGYELDLATMAIGGWSLERHLNCLTNSADRSYTLVWNRGGNAQEAWPELAAIQTPTERTNKKTGVKYQAQGANLAAVLKAVPWDIVTLQQSSDLSWKLETIRPEGEALRKAIKDLSPQAEIVMQETWSYTPWDGRLAVWKLDPNTLYARIHRAYYDFAASYGGRVIPMGTAVQLWRERLPVTYTENSLGGDVCGGGTFVREANGTFRFQGDTHHLNADGEFLQGLVWTAKLFNADVTKGTYMPAGMPAKRARLLRAVAAAAVRGEPVPVTHGGNIVPAAVTTGMARLRAAGVTGGEIAELDYNAVRKCLRVAYVLRPSPVSYIRCELSLPDPAKWNGRLWGYGNGGWAGKTGTPWWPDSTAQVTTDLGTSRLSIRTNPCDIEILRDFGWRATHLMTVEAKRLIALYYGRQPDHSYFSGASTGGGQGFCEMQRYPEDYDGIVACVPGNDRLARATGLWQLMRARKLAKPFTDQECKTIRQAELDYFAQRDPAIARGRFIWDPTPTPEKLNGCWQAIIAADPKLADREAAWRSLFDDAVVRGRRLEPGALIGIELNPPWTFILEKYTGPIPWGGVTEEQLLFFADEPNTRHVNDDLSAFIRRGGKVITFGGLEDMAVPARPITEYFDAVARRVGGVEKAQQFFVHYLIPGRQHCAGRDRKHGFVGEPRALNAKIIAWVEKGEAPGALTVPFVDDPKTTLTVLPYPAGAVAP